MPRLVLNNTQQPLENMPESWGELLNGLEEEAGRRGEVVAAVRIDGVEEPTFRQLTLAGRGLCDLALIEVETAKPGDLIDDALAQGAMAADTFAVAVSQACQAFRGADLAGANQRLAGLGDGIRSLMSILSTGAVALGVSLDRMDWNGRAVSAQLNELVSQLEAIVEAQQTDDWLTVADILEYDIQPALSTWGPVFDALRSASPA